MISDIRTLLEGRLKTWADAQSPSIPVAWQNVPFTPPTGRFLRAWVMPAETGSETLDGAHRRYAGVFQVNVFVPQGTGPAAGEALAEAIAALYPMNDLLSMTGLDVMIVSPMSIAQGFNSDGRYVVPVSCRYRADTI